MMLVSKALLVLLLACAATAIPISLVDSLPTEVVLPPFPAQDDLDTACAIIGAFSGASGCREGTSGLCAFMTSSIQPTSVFCVSKAHLKEFVEVYPEFASTYSKDQDLQLRPEVPEPSRSIIASARNRHYASDMCLFPNQPWELDRTVRKVLQLLAEGKHEDLCVPVNSRSEVLRGNSVLPYCTPTDETPFTDYDHECFTRWGSLLCTIRCPEYGRASFGYCEEDVQYLKEVCSRSSLPGRCVPHVDVLNSVVANTDAVTVGECTPLFGVPVSDRFNHVYGLYDTCQSPEDVHDCEVLSTELVSTGCEYAEECGVTGTVQMIVKIRPPECGGQTCQAVLEANGFVEVDCPIGHYCTSRIVSEELCEAPTCSNDGDDCVLGPMFICGEDNGTREILQFGNPGGRSCSQVFFDDIIASEEWCSDYFDPYINWVASSSVSPCTSRQNLPYDTTSSTSDYCTNQVTDTSHVPPIGKSFYIDHYSMRNIPAAASAGSFMCNYASSPTPIPRDCGLYR
jgi:hypothetical protein